MIPSKTAGETKDAEEIPRPCDVFSKEEDCFPAHLLHHAREAILPNRSNQEVRYVRHPIDSSILRDKTGRPVTVDRFLSTKPVQSHISSRPGPGGRKLYYLTGEGVTRTLNDLFGSSGWNLQIINTTQTHCAKERGDRWMVAYTAHVRLTAGEAFREDYGAGDSQDKSLQTALQHALKASITDALKRAARHWGDVLGNSLYEKSFTIGGAPKTVQEALDLLDKERLKVWGPPSGVPMATTSSTADQPEKCHEPAKQPPLLQQKAQPYHQTHRQQPTATAPPNHHRSLALPSSSSSSTTSTMAPAITSGQARQGGVNGGASTTSLVATGPARTVSSASTITSSSSNNNNNIGTGGPRHAAATATSVPPAQATWQIGTVTTLPSRPSISTTLPTHNQPSTDVRHTPLAETTASSATPWQPPARTPVNSYPHVTPQTPALANSNSPLTAAQGLQNRYTSSERPDSRRKRSLPEPLVVLQPPLKKNPYAAACS